uniref:Uncharacterized protein n=1 Tax=Rhizophora mucronata TaxID=61149 RepID=A0A2P2KHR0_RHIMU
MKLKALINQSRNPVRRHTAFLTCLRSFPLSVLPTPSSTEQATAGDCALATISCGGSISPSASSASSSISSNSLSPVLLIAIDRTGTLTGAEWCRW